MITFFNRAATISGLGSILPLRGKNWQVNNVMSEMMITRTRNDRSRCVFTSLTKRKREICAAVCDTH